MFTELSLLWCGELFGVIPGKEELWAAVEREVLDGTGRCSATLPHLYGSDGLDFAKVNDDGMGEGFP